MHPPAATDLTSATHIAGITHTTSQGTSEPSPPSTPPAEKEKTSSEPTVVYLHPQDPRRGEYSWDADRAMSVIGIKRSRLTQISGKDLHCARIKIGRYIRPMYRPHDVEAYVQRLRIPRSQQKSKHVIEQSTSKLITEAENLSTSLQDHIQDLDRSQHQKFLQVLKALKEEFANSHHQYKQLYEDAQQHWQRSSQQIKQDLHSTHQACQNIKAQLHHSETKHQNTHAILKEMMQHHHTWTTTLNSHLLQLHEAVRDLQCSLEETRTLLQKRAQNRPTGTTVYLIPEVTHHTALPSTLTTDQRHCKKTYQHHPSSSSTHLSHSPRGRVQPRRLRPHHHHHPSSHHPSYHPQHLPSQA